MALEERSEIQDIKIVEIENRGRTVSIPPTNTAVSITLSGSSSWSSGIMVDVQIAEMKAAMQKFSETVSSQATSVAALTRHISNNGVKGGGRNGGVGGHTTVKRISMSAKNARGWCGTRKQIARSTSAISISDGSDGRVR